MAMVTLTTLWLNDAANLNDYAVFPAMSKLTLSPAVTGEVRQMASNHTRLVTRKNLVQSAAITLPACDRPVVAWLESHVGDLMLVRDNTGRKFYGAYFGLNADEDGIHNIADIDLTVVQVSHDEAV